MKSLLLSSALIVAVSLSADAKSAKDAATVYGYPYTQVPFTSVKIAHDSFWGARLKAAREVTVPLAFSKCESEHRYRNFDMAAYTLCHPGHAGLQTPEWDVAKIMGLPFDDTDVYKTIEGASYILQTYPDSKLKAYIDSVLNIVGAAQEPDGYLYTARTINPSHPHKWSGMKRWTKEEDLSHELYDLGHMVDAACAHFQATGSRPVPSDLYSYSDTERPSYVVTLNGKRVEADVDANRGYMPVKGVRKGDVIRVHLDMPVRTVVADNHVSADRGRVAVERGPLVYCAEAADNQGAQVLRAVMAKKPSFTVVDNYQIQNTESEGAPSFTVKAITADGQLLEDTADGVDVKDHKLTLIPYYAWNHRGAGEMNVWFVQSLDMLDE